MGGAPTSHPPGDPLNISTLIILKLAQFIQKSLMNCRKQWKWKKWKIFRILKVGVICRLQSPWRHPFFLEPSGLVELVLHEVFLQDSSWRCYNPVNPQNVPISALADLKRSRYVKNLRSQDSSWAGKLYTFFEYAMCLVHQTRTDL